MRRSPDLKRSGVLGFTLVVAAAACSGPSCISGPLSACGDRQEETETEPPGSFALVVSGGGTGSGLVTSTPEGITCGVDNGAVAGDCAAPFAEGTVVVLSQAPEPGSEFMAWGGACSGATCTVTLSEDRTVSATFDFTDRVLVSGTVTVKQTFLVDLDVGAANEDAAKEGWDLWFQAETAIRRYLTPWAPAELAFAGRSAPGRRGCAEADLGSGRVQLFPESPAGTFLCVVTNEGRLAEVEILAAPTASPGTIPLRFRTWATPVR